MALPYRQTSLGGVAPAPPVPPTVTPVSIGVFMDDLERQGVTFDLVANELRVAVPSGALSEAERHALVARREEVKALVRVARGPYQPVAAPSEPAAPTQTTWAAA